PMPRTSLALILLVATAFYSADARAHRRATAPAAGQQSGVPSDQKTERAGYVGDAVCGSCHHDLFGTFQLTVHHRTSALPSVQSISGSFTPPKNILQTLDPALIFRMDSRDGHFFQTAIIGQPPRAQEHSEEFGIVVGSGHKGQTYLYWKRDELFELPVSYWTELGQWVNSPGYLDGTANFDRPVIPRCVECHATYFQTLAPSPLMNRYDKADFVLGISCERCHGPGEEHVARHRGPSAASAGEGIANPANLSRDRQVDVCAQCHGGLGEEITPTFSFRPGEPLANFIKLQQLPVEAVVDVHGNQAALLERSRCYQSSGTLACTTCHDEHAPEQPAASYSSHCLACHKPEKCGMYAKLGPQIAANCIDCHMPVQQSNLIVSDVNGTSVRARVRNHWIKVYSNPATELR
ncbi:MAG: multiheme c-type cytochrome, partial [Candidatus Acidiferrales bacterium]